MDVFLFPGCLETCWLEHQAGSSQKTAILMTSVRFYSHHWGDTSKSDWRVSYQLL